MIQMHTLETHRTSCASQATVFLCYIFGFISTRNSCRSAARAQTGKQSDRHRHRQTDRHTHTDTQTHTDTHTHAHTHTLSQTTHTHTQGGGGPRGVCQIFERPATISRLQHVIPAHLQYYTAIQLDSHPRIMSILLT